MTLKLHLLVTPNLKCDTCGHESFYIDDIEQPNINGGMAVKVTCYNCAKPYLLFPDRKPAEVDRPQSVG